MRSILSRELLIKLLGGLFGLINIVVFYNTFEDYISEYVVVQSLAFFVGVVFRLGNGVKILESAKVDVGTELGKRDSPLFLFSHQVIGEKIIGLTFSFFVYFFYCLIFSYDFSAGMLAYASSIAQFLASGARANRDPLRFTIFSALIIPLIGGASILTTIMVAWINVDINPVAFYVSVQAIISMCLLLYFFDFSKARFNNIVFILLEYFSISKSSIFNFGIACALPLFVYACVEELSVVVTSQEMMFFEVSRRISLYALFPLVLYSFRVAASFVSEFSFIMVIGFLVSATAFYNLEFGSIFIGFFAAFCTITYSIVKDLSKTGVFSKKPLTFIFLYTAILLLNGFVS